MPIYNDPNKIGFRLRKNVPFKYFTNFNYLLFIIMQIDAKINWQVNAIDFWVFYLKFTQFLYIKGYKLYSILSVRLKEKIKFLLAGYFRNFKFIFEFENKTVDVNFANKQCNLYSVPIIYLTFLFQIFNFYSNDQQL